MKKNIFILASFLLMIYSCNEKPDTQQKTTAFRAENMSRSKVVSNNEHPLFPETGKNSFDFVPENHEIQYEAEGDLNQDGFPDRALVLRKKSDTLASRNVLILLQNADKTYRLDAASRTVLPAQYNQNGRKIYHPENISIGKSELNIQLYNVASNGNLFSKFKYLNNNLVLTYVEAYSKAIGRNTGLYYEVMKGKLTEEVLHIMTEEPFLNSQTYDLAAEQLLFETASPQEAISKAYTSIALQE